MKKFNRAIFPGSFNPFHEGHLFVLKQALKHFKQVIIFIGNNPNKAYKNYDERFEQVTKFLQNNNINNVNIVFGNDLTVDVAKRFKCKYIVRGIRDNEDLIYEQDLKKEIKKINPKIKFINFRANYKFINYRSSTIKN